MENSKNNKKDFIEELLKRRHSEFGDLVEATSSGDDMLLAMEFKNS